jgi:hypothetical protein
MDTTSIYWRAEQDAGQKSLTVTETVLNMKDKDYFLFLHVI